ncbi:sulfite exporter TauE/SafE family protein [Actinotalea sp. M2MS4P-6]|uniref:sulfite exporter TauE/SafE family protein n=1 Tax=Actinotalea sp. M2MS4P-6 TaxID=2983762 RepID=UPI0021E3B63D|nr:sulfite exporter TauE/SafE family protein [Actinotalea sp. M2MS4P-6]MCV2393612.1 sulfite exporter TauE/SafE family protein [Actinotalea sp. M2MS4P-6]
MPVSPSLRRWVALILIGAAGGVLSGMFGVGGGIIMVPLLLSFGGMDQRQAASTSLVAVLPTSIVGSISYLARGEADLRIGALVAIGGIVGSLIGTWLLRRLPMAALRWMFIVLLLAVALRMLTAQPVRGHEVEWNVGIVLGLVAVGLVAGIAAGLFGIGGGVIVVPALILLLGVSDLLAKGTSLVVMILTSITGTVANARRGLVDVRVGIVVGASASAASFLGVALAFLLPARLSSVLFALLVLVTAAQLSVRAVRAQRRGV